MSSDTRARIVSSGKGKSVPEIARGWCDVRGEFQAGLPPVALHGNKFEAQCFCAKRGTSDEPISIHFEEQLPDREDENAGWKGKHVWTSAFALTEYIAMHDALFAGKVVVEIGAGVGLPGLMAGALGASKVYLCDCPEYTDVLELTQRNVDLNDLSRVCQVRPLAWGRLDRNLLMW
eukprot:CAMPEP_0198737188 /NCGR_PEP_ID=MMETSP1475-20131203/67739_1 /TAXON_ID= ORGANISM="Unidentified sp., Strain CCMP1999" /NCGR_SAMPLE_ID=MMETSP1475 /ASSEMBLY_ACC=CAM_ASM_001111 /LENGTH=175 /DNA_ID=CAMNT_0044501045 /DNA_START=521 /DNA_END=1046 /DNA_ORIENTATION=-